MAGREGEELLFIENFLCAFLQIPLNPHSNPVRQEDTEAQFNTCITALPMLVIILVSKSDSLPRCYGL